MNAQNCDFSGAGMLESDLSEGDFEKSNFEETDLRRCVLKNAIFAHSDFLIFRNLTLQWQISQDLI